MSKQIISFPIALSETARVSRLRFESKGKIINCSNPEIWALTDLSSIDDPYVNMSVVELIVSLSQLTKRLVHSCETRHYRNIPSISARLALCARALGFDHTQNQAKLLGELAMERRYKSCKSLIDETARIVDGLTARYFEISWKNLSQD